MTKFILKTIHGDRITITGEQHAKILKATTDIIALDNGITIRKNVIATIFPESQADEIENKKQQQTGILHDGTRVIRHFGEWILPEYVPNDSGKDVPVKIDPTYYPEVAADFVPTEKEYHEKYEHLPRDKRLAAIMGDVPRSRKRISDGKTKSMKELLAGRL
jgi:hypothetical protein